MFVQFLTKIHPNRYFVSKLGEYTFIFEGHSILFIIFTQSSRVPFVFITITLSIRFNLIQ